MPAVSFSVVIPRFNKEPQAEASVRAVCDELDRVEQNSALIVVHDGSADNTAAILESLCSDLAKRIVVEDEVNRGCGVGLRTGIRTVIERGFDNALFMYSNLTKRAEGQRGTSCGYTPVVFRDYLKYPLRCFLVRRPSKAS